MRVVACSLCRSVSREPRPWGGDGEGDGEGGVGAGVDDCVVGGAVGEGGMGVSVDEVGAGLWLMVVSWWVCCSRCRRRRWCWCL